MYLPNKSMVRSRGGFRSVGFVDAGLECANLVCSLETRTRISPLSVVVSCETGLSPVLYKYVVELRFRR
jgi:hypothetical protein